MLAPVDRHRLRVGGLEHRAAHVPVPAVGLEALGLGVAGLVIGAGLRAWRGYLMPSHLAVTGVLAAALLSDALPRAWKLNQAQFWGPPWEAAHLRWLAVLLLAAAALTLLLRDPLDRAGRAKAP